MYRKVYKWMSDSFIKWLTYEKAPQGIPLCDFERIRYELRPGDVLLIEGRSRVSEIIQSITQSTWSHAALYVGRLHDIEDHSIRENISEHYLVPPDSQLIIEGVMGKGTIVSELTLYAEEHIRICRPRGLSRLDAQKVTSYAAAKLGCGYDVRQVLDLARFLLPWTVLPKKFRSRLFEHHAGESTQTVCSTMIAEAFESVDFPILPLVKEHATKGLELIRRNPKLYTPRDFDYSPYFDIIKHPYIEHTDCPAYRRLPWNRDGLMSHDDAGVNVIERPSNYSPWGA